MADVFISYHEESAGELAEQIADALDDAGISAWCARRDMALGGNFAREIPNQIHACRLFLLILDDNVYHSEHIENEVGIAFSRVNKKENIRILPLELGEFTRKDWVEYYLIHTQGVKFPAQPDEKRLQRLVKQIAKALNQETQPAPQIQPPPQPAPKSAPPKVQAQPAPIPQATPEPPLVEIIKSGKCGDNVNYTLDENGVLTISGNGPMWDFEVDVQTNICNTPWIDKCRTITSIVILNGLTTIGEFAFFDCIQLINVTIPDSMIKIGKWAFSHCANLKSVTIPSSVTEIERYAFSYCTALRRVTISEGVTEIEEGAFMHCLTLKSVNIPDSVNIIGSYAFCDCINLKSVSVPANAEINYTAFADWDKVTRRK